MKPLAVRIEGKSLCLMPAGCIHWPVGEKDLLVKWVDALRADPTARGILMGDSLDLARSHFRNHIRSYREDENSQEALDEGHRREVRDLAKVLEPVRGKLWGAIVGNHRWEFSDGTHSEQYLCQLLGIPFLGAVGMIRVVFNTGIHKTDKRRTVVVFAHHSGGSSGARTTGGDVASMVRVEAGETLLQTAANSGWQANDRRHSLGRPRVVRHRPSALLAAPRAELEEGSSRNQHLGEFRRIHAVNQRMEPAAGFRGRRRGAGACGGDEGVHEQGKDGQSRETPANKGGRASLQ